jgi:hypothetical protein
MIDLLLSAGLGDVSPSALLSMAVVVALCLVTLALGLVCWVSLARRVNRLLDAWLARRVAALAGAPPDPRLVPILFCEDDGRRLLRWGELISE